MIKKGLANGEFIYQLVDNKINADDIVIPGPSIRYRISSDLVGFNHPTEFDWFRLDSGRFSGLGIKSEPIVLNPIGSYSRSY
jgi:hypothetical protein